MATKKATRAAKSKANPKAAVSAKPKAKSKAPAKAKSKAPAKAKSKAPAKAKSKANVKKANAKVGRSKAKAKPAPKVSAKVAKVPSAKPAKASARAGAPGPSKGKALAKAPARVKSKPKAAQPKAPAEVDPKAADTLPPPPSEMPASEHRVTVGDVAPSFELEDDSGALVSSESLRGEPYILYFYPKDDTPGCTTEACGFRDSLPSFSAKGVKVIGVSPDPVKSHVRFKEKYGLTFPLLADLEKELAKAYGVWVLKENYGRQYMGVERSTFVVDAEGVIRQSWRGVRVPGHVDEVFATL